MRTWALALVLVGCGAAQAPASHAPAADLGYTLTLAPTLDRATVALCPLASPLPDALVATHDEARAHLRSARVVEGDHVVRELAVGARLDLSGVPAHACVQYEIDLASCHAPRGPTGCGRSGRDLFAPTSVWLFAPETRRLSAHYDLRFVLPPGVSVTPIAERASPSDGTHFVLDERSFAFVGYLAFVHAAPRTVPVPGGCMDVITLDGALDADAETQAAWLTTAATASARVTGRPPFDRLTALVIPSLDYPPMPVLFGVAGRGMRPTVTLLVSEHADARALISDWTAVHELAHFLTAYVEGEDTWLSEGLATYYEEVLRARERMRTEEETWSALTNGFSRGRADASMGTLREAARHMRSSGSFTRVYWQGAALVFLADLAYREEGSSLDEAIARAWPHRGERTSAAQLIAWLDGREDGPFARIAAAALDAPGFPDVQTPLAWLGVHDEGDRVMLDPEAPGAAVRRALMNGAPAPTSNPSSCTADGVLSR